MHERGSIPTGDSGKVKIRDSILVTKATSLAANWLSLTNVCCLVGSEKATAARQHKVCWSERQRCFDKTKQKKKLRRCRFGVTLPQCKWRITFFFFFLAPAIFVPGVIP